MEVLFLLDEHILCFVKLDKVVGLEGVTCLSYRTSQEKENQRYQEI